MPLIVKMFWRSGTSRQDFVGPVGIGRQIVEIGLLGRIGEGEEHALVLGRRQFLVDRHVEDAGHRHDDDQHEGEDRPLLDRLR